MTTPTTTTTSEERIAALEATIVQLNAVIQGYEKAMKSLGVIANHYTSLGGVPVQRSVITEAKV